MKRKSILLALALGVLVAPPAFAKAELGLQRLGGSIGYVSPEDLDGTFGLGVFADMGRITPEISLEPRIDWWSQSESAFGSEVSVRDIAIGARAKYHFATSNPNLRPFAGAGLGLHFLRAEVEMSFPGFPTETYSDSETRLGLDLGGGLATTMSPKVDLIGEAWYGVVEDFSHFALRVGLSYRLGS